ncbi:DNA-binding response regulator [Bacillus thuringiensis]|uniref:response regulator transcription factor n=1 Tax=Bacillus TaxID=1386 RepID=UPI000BEB33A4|nr:MULTISPECIES: response regulator transcription factor [Bacillus]MCU5408284.1 response regulator transcription factor [Bacillus cereus]MBJ8099632.1 response regulator transcription factor [Bacillus cereus group sp. N11]MDR4924396.1 response regulator transcription factor [Bacillus thuringiensis]MED3526258.1 response regulator transcription factor [Bacillus thuringiensis]PEC99044.1 DNA-binding response regulator [Bacillus thuringiensis]
MKIMIIEDERTIREMMAETIEKWGFDTVKVEDFDQVLSIFLKENPHLVLMDINLPSFDGFYWCNKIRESSKTPIIFLSSRNTPMDMIMAMNMGGDDFVNKPFHTDVLMAKINALLRRTYTYIEDIELNILEYDGIVLDLNSYNVSYMNETIALSKNEFIIFNLLMQNKGTVVSRTKIMRSLWADERFVDENTLAVNIARIRKKITELGKEDFITTKKGYGYIIV